MVLGGQPHRRRGAGVAGGDGGRIDLAEVAPGVDARDAMTHHLDVADHRRAGAHGFDSRGHRIVVDYHRLRVLEIGAGMNHAGHNGRCGRCETSQVHARLEDAVALGLDGVDGADRGHEAASKMASVGHTSMHARHVVHRASTTNGRRGAGSSARSGHVMTQRPQAVQRPSIRTVVTTRTPAA